MKTAISILKRFCKNGKYGYMDISGLTVIPPQYNHAYDFSEGLAIVELNTYGKKKVFGAINTVGELQFEFECDNVIAIENEYGGVIERGFAEGFAVIEIGDKYGFIHKSGKIVLYPIYDALFPFCEGMALYSNNGKWGYLNTDIKVAIEAQYYGAGLFSEGVAPVSCEGEIRNKHGWHIERDGVSSVSDMQWGFINKSGEYVIAPKFLRAGSFSEGLAAVEKRIFINIVKHDDQYGYVNKKGYFDRLQEDDINTDCFDKGLYLFGNKEYIYDSECLKKEHFKEHFDVFEYSKIFDYIEKWGFIDKNGNLVIEPKFDSVMGFSEGVAAIEINNKWGFIDKLGNLIIPPKFEDVKPFSEGLSAVKIVKSTGWKGWFLNPYESKWGFIDKSGDFIIKPEFETVFENFYGNTALVGTRKHTYYINKKGEKVRQFTFSII